jgi:small GTP-binding protein
MSNEIKLDKDDDDEIQNEIQNNNDLNNQKNNNNPTSSIKEQKEKEILNNNNNKSELNSNSTSNKNSSYQFIFKIILIGDSNTGKTSLINRYINNNFKDKYHCTIGVDFLMKKIYFEDILVKLQIWDTAGMEKYKQITSSYYRGAQGCIVVFDLTNIESFYSLQKWIDDYCQISKNQNNIYIVGNKCDLNDNFQVSNEDVIKFCKNNNGFKYVQTSAKTGENVQKIFEDISKELIDRYKNLMIKDGNLNKNNLNDKNNIVNLSTAIQNENKNTKTKKECC